MLRKALTLIAMIVSLTASAKTVFNEGVNSVNGYTSVDGVFTCTTGGKVLIEAMEIWKISYEGQTYEQNYVPGSVYPYTYEISDVKPGAEISIKSDFTWRTDGKVRITVYAGAVPVELYAVTPAMGKTFDWNTTGMISLNFNKNVVVSKVMLLAGDYAGEVDELRLGTSVSFYITNALNTAINEGHVKAGDKFQVAISGLRDAEDDTNLYNGNGRLLLDYVVPSAQHKFVSATVGENMLSYTQTNTYKFLSYYDPEEADGLFVFEFDGPVGKVGAVTLIMGNLDLDSQGKYHRSQMPYTIEGNKVLVDARGTLRSLAVLFPAMVEDESGEGEEGVSSMLGTFDTEHLTIALTNVLDTEGNAFVSDNAGSIGSYYFVMGYEEIIDEAFMDGDNKQEGDEVVAGEDISLWVSNADLKFDGIEIIYRVEVPTQDEVEEGTVYSEPRTVIVNDYTVEPDMLEGAILTFTMPELPGIMDGSNIRVALLNARSSDGMPHYLYINFVSPSTATGIAAMSGAVRQDGKIYRLDGVQMTGKLPAGIYVRNGKTFIVSK